MRVLADHNIPLAEDFFSTVGAVETLPASMISSERLSDADILLVRSVTSVNDALLDGSRVQFVGSATSGTDHVDLEYLRDRGIGFAHASGANADSVVEYVLAALLHQCVCREQPPREQTVGLIGCGNIGGRLARRLPALEFRIRCCDPFLADAGAQDARAAQSPISGAPTGGPAGAPAHAPEFLPLDDVLSSSDVVTLHVPLHGPPHATRHLLDASALDTMRPGALLINTSRGAVVDSGALMSALAGGSLAGAVLDVWENEPAPEANLIRRAALATPHIAGYSYDGKVAGTRMLYEAVCRHFDVDVNDGAVDANGAAANGGADVSEEAGRSGTAAVRESAALHLSPPDPTLPPAEAIHWLIQQMYDIAADDRRMRPLAELPDEERRRAFIELRRQYPRRRTFSRFSLDPETLPAELHRAVYQGLGIQKTRDTTR